MGMVGFSLLRKILRLGNCESYGLRAVRTTSAGNRISDLGCRRTYARADGSSNVPVRPCGLSTASGMTTSYSAGDEQSLTARKRRDGVGSAPCCCGGSAGVAVSVRKAPRSSVGHFTHDRQTRDGDEMQKRRRKRSEVEIAGGAEKREVAARG